MEDRSTGGTGIDNAPTIRYRVTDRQLTAVADAIRSRGGTQAPIVFPDGFIEAIGAISTGIPSNYGKITFNGASLKVE